MSDEKEAAEVLEVERLDREQRVWKDGVIVSISCGCECGMCVW